MDVADIVLLTTVALFIGLGIPGLIIDEVKFHRKMQILSIMISVYC